MRTRYYALVVIILMVFNFNNLAQHEHNSSETSWDVPELFSFHDVIYQIWHTAFPSKDIDMLKGYVQEVNSSADKIFQAELPGILRDKNDKWKQGIEKFKSTVKRYNNAASSNDDKEMLDAAEELHSDFEMLVRIIKPMSKEIDDYHQTLYLIYHYYFPQKDYNKLKESAIELFAKIQTIKKSEVPRRAVNIKEEYWTSINDLYNATEEFKSFMEQEKFENIDDLVENVHTKYQAVEHLFD